MVYPSVDVAPGSFSQLNLECVIAIPGVRDNWRVPDDELDNQINGTSVAIGVIDWTDSGENVFHPIMIFGASQTQLRVKRIESNISSLLPEQDTSFLWNLVSPENFLSVITNKLNQRDAWMEIINNCGNGTLDRAYLIDLRNRLGCSDNMDGAIDIVTSLLNTATESTIMPGSVVETFRILLTKIKGITGSESNSYQGVFPDTGFDLINFWDVFKTYIPSIIGTAVTIIAAVINPVLGLIATVLLGAISVISKAWQSTDDQNFTLNNDFDAKYVNLKLDTKYTTTATIKTLFPTKSYFGIVRSDEVYRSRLAIPFGYWFITRTPRNDGSDSDDLCIEVVPAVSDLMKMSPSLWTKLKDLGLKTGDNQTILGWNWNDEFYTTAWWEEFINTTYSDDDPSNCPERLDWASFWVMLFSYRSNTDLSDSVPGHLTQWLANMASRSSSEWTIDAVKSDIDTYSRFWGGNVNVVAADMAAYSPSADGSYDAVCAFECTTVGSQINGMFDVPKYSHNTRFFVILAAAGLALATIAAVTVKVVATKKLRSRLVYEQATAQKLNRDMGNLEYGSAEYKTAYKQYRKANRHASWIQSILGVPTSTTGRIKELSDASRDASVNNSTKGDVSTAALLAAITGQ